MDFDNLQKTSSRLSDIYSNNPDIVKASKMLSEQFQASLDQKTLQAISDIAKNAQAIISDIPSVSTETISLLASIAQPVRLSLKQSGLSKAGLELLRTYQAPHLETEEPLFEIGEDYVDISDTVVDIMSSLNPSVEIPQSDSHSVVRINKSSDGALFLNVVAFLLNLIMFLATIKFNSDSTALENQHHAGIMQEEKLQTKTLEEISDKLDYFITLPDTVQELQEDVHSLQEAVRELQEEQDSLSVLSQPSDD